MNIHLYRDREMDNIDIQIIQIIQIKRYIDDIQKYVDVGSDWV